jgi:hypothetical protein
VNAFWKALVEHEQVPFVLEEQVAFLYRGRARTVRWIGDFADWQRGPPLQGQQVGKSDLWVAYATFPSNARLEYRIVVDDKEAIPDPANPLQPWGGFGPNSVVDDTVYQGYRSADRLPLKVYLRTGYPWDFDARTTRRPMEERGYDLLYLETPEGHSWGQWRSRIDDLLDYLMAP